MAGVYMCAALFSVRLCILGLRGAAVYSQLGCICEGLYMSTLVFEGIAVATLCTVHTEAHSKPSITRIRYTELASKVSSMNDRLHSATFWIGFRERSLFMVLGWTLNRMAPVLPCHSLSPWWSR